MQNLINSTYEHQLAYHYHNIDKRGLFINEFKRDHVREQVQKELDDKCSFLSNLWNTQVYVGADNAPDNGKDSININSSQKLPEKLKSLGYDIPKIRKKNQETDDYEMKDSTGELALVKTLADPNRWPNPQSGDGIKVLLECKEIITFRNRYANARLHRNTYYSAHNVAATVTGRRGSKKSIYGIGGNDQNFPSRGRLADLWKECVIARPGKIFFFVDQKSAEDWPVQALSENHTALDEMRRGVNRHYKFASEIFNIPVDILKAIRQNKTGQYTEAEQLDAEMKYYMGKKGRHANNYGMQPPRFSESLAAEGGFTVPVDSCKNILSIIDKLDPNVKRIFHKYVQEELSKPTHILRTPLGRERQFLGLRSGEKNYSIFNEAYAYIPQSVVGDNTGLAVAYLEGVYNFIVQDGHDSIVQEIPDSESEIRWVFTSTNDAFKRDITFHNGITINIPIEGAIGYDWKHKISLEDYTEDCLMAVYKEVQEKYGRKELLTNAYGA